MVIRITFIYFININVAYHSKGLGQTLERTAEGYQLTCSRQLHLMPPEVNQCHYHSNNDLSLTALLETGLKNYGLRRKPVAEGMHFQYFQAQYSIA